MLKNWYNKMNEKIKYKLLTFIRYLGDSFFYPFFALYLHSKDNIGETKIGILIAITPFIGIVMNPIFSKICKNFKTLKTVLGIIGIMEALMICIILNSNTFVILLISTILLSIFGCSHYGLCDSLLTIYATENKINFSNIRVYGSISYIFGTAIAGILIDKFNDYQISFYVCTFFFILASILYLSLKNVYNESKKEEKRNLKELLTNKGFILFMIFYMIMYGILKTNNNFYSLLLEERGLSESVFGFNYFIFVGIEAIVLILLNKFNKKSNYKTLMFIAIISIAIMLLVNSAPIDKIPAYVLIIFSALRGVSWGIILHVTNKVIVSQVGVKNATLGTMALDLAYSIVVIICNTIGGYIMENVSYQSFFFILAVIGFIDAVFYLAVVRDNICINDEIDASQIEEIGELDETIYSDFF